MPKEKILAKIEIRAKDLNKTDPNQDRQYNGMLSPVGGNRYIIYVDLNHDISSTVKTLYHEFSHLIIRVLMKLWLDGKKLKCLSRLIDKPLSEEEVVCEKVAQASYRAIKGSLERIKK